MTEHSRQPREQKAKTRSNSLDKKWMIVLTLAVIALVLLLVVLFGPGNSENEEGQHGLGVIQTFAFDHNTAARYYPVGEKLLLLRPEQVTLQDYRGQQYASIPLDYQQAVAIVDRERALCGDRLGTRVIQFDSNGALFEAQLDGGLAGAAYNGSSTWAVIDEIPDKHPIVHLLKEDGNRIATLTFDLSGSPVKVGFTPDGKLLDIVILDSKGSRIKTILKRFDLQGNQVAQRVLEGYDSLFYNLTHDSSGNPVVNSSATVVRFRYDQEDSVQSADFAFVSAVYAHGDALTILAGNQQDSALSAYEMKEDGTLETTETYFPSIDLSLRSGDTVILAGGASLYRYNQNSRKSELLGTLDGKVSEMLGLGGNKLAVVTNRAASIIQLP